MNEFERRSLDIAQSSVYLALYERTNQQIIGIEQFGYNIAIPALATNVTQTATIQILSDSDFVLTYLSSQQITTATQTVPSNYFASTLQITDTGTGKTFYNQPTLSSLVTGQGGYPFLLAAPRLIAPNTNINFTVTNLSPVTLDFYFSMQGARIYYAQKSS